MWKFILSAMFFLSTACFASDPFAAMQQKLPELSNQLSPEQLFADQQEFELESENGIVVDIEQVEDIIEDINRHRFSKSDVKIWFVDNTNPNPGNGKYKNPFNTLLAAQEASKKGDIIFVFPGDNTPTGMDQGFVMKNKQRLLGAGVHHTIEFPEKKLIIRAPSTTLPRITNTSGNVIILANSCEVSGINIVNISGGDGILGGDPNPAGPQTRGIKNTLIRKNVINTFQRDQNLVVNGAIYLPNCRGELIVQHNYIFNVLSAVAAEGGIGIHLLNANRPVSSEVIIKKNIVSNTGADSILLSHSAPRGKVHALVAENFVFNIGQIGDAIFIGTEERFNAGGLLCVTAIKNFAQNVHAGFDLHIQSSGSAHVKAEVIENVVARSAILDGGGVLAGIAAVSLDSSRLCLKLVRNFSEFGYALSQLGASRFHLEPLHKNLGLPFTVIGAITRVGAGRCDCDRPPRLASGGCDCN